MPQNPVVAIAGASGHLGIHVARAVYAELKHGKFKELIILARSGSKRPSEMDHWENSGTVTLRRYYEDSSVSELRETLTNVDVLVNIIGTGGYKFRDKLIEAIAGSTVSLYLPSEFGVDHTIHDFGHPEWDHKKAHMEIAKKLLPNVKICRVFAGLFLEDSIGPWFGFDTKKSVYECLGSKDTLVSFTSLDDVGKAVAQLVQLPIDRIPDQIHLAGDTKSVSQIADLMSEQSGADIKVVEKNLQAYRETQLASPRPDPSGCLRFLMGEGKIDHSSSGLHNQNELVNPRESKWHWKTLRGEARVTDGQPWGDIDWQ